MREAVSLWRVARRFAWVVGGTGTAFGVVMAACFLLMLGLGRAIVWLTQSHPVAALYVIEASMIGLSAALAVLALHGFSKILRGVWRDCYVAEQDRATPSRESTTE
jgi:hypothetical protein